MPAAIALVARSGVLATDRLLFTLADQTQTLGGDASANQVVANRSGASLPQCEVVLVGATGVRVALNRHTHRRPAAQIIAVPLQRVTLVGPDVELVVVEHHIHELPRHI